MINMEVRDKAKAREATNFIKTEGKNLSYKREEVECHFRLKKVTVDELVELRLGEKPGIILKNEGEYWYAKANQKISLVSLGEHLCNSCRRCIPSSDEDGGCAKVRDVSVERKSRDETKTLVEIVEDSKRIEKYEFITSGIEVINSRQEGLLVLECENFMEYLKREPKPIEEVLALKQAALDFYNSNM